QVGAAGDGGVVGVALADGDSLLDEVPLPFGVAFLEQFGHPGVDGGALDAGPGVAVGAGDLGPVARFVGERPGAGVADFGGADAALPGAGCVVGGVDDELADH